MKHRRIFTRLAAALLVAAFLPTAALADSWYLEDGDITVSATESGQPGCGGFNGQHRNHRGRQKRHRQRHPEGRQY